MALLLVPLLLGVLLAGGCEYRASSEAGKALEEETERAATPDQTSESVRFFIYEDDQPRALVEAARMERYEREDSTYTLLLATDTAATTSPGIGAGPAAPDEGGRVTARIYDAGGDSQGEGDADGAPSGPHRGNAVAATIRSNRLVYHDEERRFDARGRVVVTTADGKRLEGEHLAWLEEERRITTPGFVHITTPTDRIQGYGLRADENLDGYQLQRVTGQVTVEEAP